MGKCAICGKKVERGTGPFFQVPSDETKRLLWDSNCRMNFRARDIVCGDHFSREVMICGGKKARLLPKAIPHPRSSIATSSYCMSVVQQMDSYCAQSDIRFSDLPAPGVCDSGISSQASLSNALAFSTEALVKDTRNQTTGLLVKDSETQTDGIIFTALTELEISNLKTEIKRLKEENEDLCLKLDEFNAVISNVKRIFTEGQIRKMTQPDQNLKWSGKDISSAICLHTAGPRAYSHLYEKGFPLPHLSTLQRWYRKTDK